MPPLDPRPLASPVIGRITRVEPVNDFAANQTFRLHTPSGVYYLKSGNTIAAEAEACDLARSLDVPSPRVIAVDLTAPTYLITAELPGEPTNSPQVLAEAGRCLRRLHTIHDPSADWPTNLLKPIETLDRLTSVLPDQLAQRLRDTVPPFVRTVADIKPALLHGDLHPRHLYAVGNKLTGVLDWGDAMYGDPLFDIARFTMSGPAPTAAFLTGYPLSRTPYINHTLSLYRALWSLMALHAEHSARGDWFQPHVDTIARELVS
ncbi:aminoglycoside phosphotransferase family protein [Kribbella sp. NBC_01510]|uniref:phosphotransferase family protein n=1 Tax=Kribbella sp. NBC_01510 TaxID=2903581 RepID=UPI003867BC0E